MARYLNLFVERSSRDCDKMNRLGCCEDETWIASRNGKLPRNEYMLPWKRKKKLKYISPDFELFVRNANEEKPLALRAGKVQRTSGCISGQERSADKCSRTLDQGLVARSGVR